MIKCDWCGCIIPTEPDTRDVLLRTIYATPNYGNFCSFPCWNKYLRPIWKEFNEKVRLSNRRAT